MRERPNRHDWKSCVLHGTVGSNPTLSAVNHQFRAVFFESWDLEERLWMGVTNTLTTTVTTIRLTTASKAAYAEERPLRVTPSDRGVSARSAGRGPWPSPRHA